MESTRISCNNQDDIGWEDPFADKTYWEWQHKYAQAFRSTRIYTPQMIVNGQHEFVGSNRARAKAYIQSSETILKVRIGLELLEFLGKKEISGTVTLTIVDGVVHDPATLTSRAQELLFIDE